MDNVRIFESEKFGKVRTVNREGGPWFVAADVCRALELSDVSMSLKRLDDDEKGTNPICTPGGEQEMSIINEPGLYALVLSSRKPEAKAFKRWITHEVIPSIRKNGAYATSLDALSEVLRDEAARNRSKTLEEQREELSRTLGVNVSLFRSRPQPKKQLTPEAAARILSGVKLAEALPLVRAALVEAGINLPEIDLIPDGPARRKYTVRVHKPVIDQDALANAIGRALAHRILLTSDLAEMAELPTRSVDRWVNGQYVPTDDALARLDAALRSNYPNLYDI